jgi:hypothetical protein
VPAPSSLAAASASITWRMCAEKVLRFAAIDWSSPTSVTIRADQRHRRRPRRRQPQPRLGHQGAQAEGLERDRLAARVRPADHQRRPPASSRSLGTTSTPASSINGWRAPAGSSNSPACPPGHPRRAAAPPRRSARPAAAAPAPRRSRPAAPGCRQRPRAWCTSLLSCSSTRRSSAAAASCASRSALFSSISACGSTYSVCPDALESWMIPATARAARTRRPGPAAPPAPRAPCRSCPAAPPRSRLLDQPLPPPSSAAARSSRTRPRARASAGLAPSTTHASPSGPSGPSDARASPPARDAAAARSMRSPIAATPGSPA